ncbi:MAG: 7,8-didemethyl-8-hydroxy-5-deazariboflavin synthase subunit CofG [Halobacteriales archaeon]|nr:7,8-didemethyl-8-hydroxy-5-deazariboflavin synthase subunit CofG [Halobacteriales archaeon]
MATHEGAGNFGDTEVERLLSVTPEDTDAPDEVTFARNVFLPLSTACVNSCDYCAFYDERGDASLMSPDEVRETLERGVRAGCTEALFSFGTRAETYPSIREELDEMGYDDTLDYLYDCCVKALELGILPHTNAGVMTYDEIEHLAEVNASMGLMLETTATVEAHEGYATKQPKRRIRAIRDAGRADVPYTTGILVGIGEGWRDRAESLLAIRDAHREHGHVQEVIVQNVVPNERSDYERPSLETVRRTVAMARVALPDDVEVQVPPNLSTDLPSLVRAGAGDLGGVSPLTDDYINPDYDWPAVERLRAAADDADAELVERLPVYPRYIEDGWLSEKVERVVEYVNS